MLTEHWLKKKLNLDISEEKSKIVNLRIRLVFGEKYGVEIESTVMEGTTLTLTMPQHSI